MNNVILIAMPSVPVYRPQLGISLLKAQLTRRSVGVDIRYLNLLWARYCFDAVVGPVTSYEDLRRKVSSRIADLLLQRIENAILVEEWIFAEALHGIGHLNADQYVNDLLPREYSQDEIAIIFVPPEAGSHLSGRMPGRRSLGALLVSRIHVDLRAARRLSRARPAPERSPPEHPDYLWWSELRGADGHGADSPFSLCRLRGERRG